MAIKKKSGTNLVEIKRGGRHYYGKTKKEANAKADAYESKQASDRLAGELFSTVAAEWWEDYRKRVKQGSDRAYHANYQSAVSAFGKMRMGEITAQDISNYLLRLAAQGKKANTVSNARSVVSLIFKYWCGHMDGNANPVSLVALPRGLPRGERLPPTPEQIEIVKNHPEGFGLCAWLFMYTGMRLGEANALQWRDIDMDAKTISITKSTVFVGNDPKIDHPKTKNAVRTISILDPLYKLFKERKGKADSFVLSGTNVPLTRSQYSERWLDYCRQNGMVVAKDHQPPEPKRKIKSEHKSSLYLLPACTAHQFRHYMASLIYEATGGTNEMLAQRWLGHADIQTTHKVYTHIRDSQVGVLGADINKLIQSQNGRKCTK